MPLYAADSNFYLFFPTLHDFHYSINPKLHSEPNIKLMHRNDTIGHNSVLVAVTRYRLVELK